MASQQHLGLVSIVIDDYDSAIEYYTSILGFRLVEDTFLREEDKRWVVVAPHEATETGLLLAKAKGSQQRSRVGNQTGGRVFLFLHTSDFWEDYRALLEKGVVFVREPRTERYGTVAVFEDRYGNLWDLLEPSEHNQSVVRRDA